jgi:poly(3-hydroxybutyrate) depolymerase
MRMLIVTLLALGASLTAPGMAAAEMIEKTGTFGGLKLTYKVLLPPGYEADTTYPAVLVFTGGPQSLQMAERTLDVDWRQEAERRGYIVISPGTPDGSLFFEGADRVFPAFLDQILRDYRVAGGKLHVAGHSNGGLSAFHVAALYPQYFATVTGYPGLLGAGDLSRASGIKPLCIFMHVGDRDDGWRGAMQQQADSLARQGYRIRIAVEEDQVHRLNAPAINLSPRLFDQIEGCSTS